MSDEQLPPQEGFDIIPNGSPFGGDAKIKRIPEFDTTGNYLSNFALMIPMAPFKESNQIQFLCSMYR